MSKDRETHRVAIVVFCEAEGVDPRDAATGAEWALNHLFREHMHADGASLVRSTTAPTCGECGATPGLTDDGVLGDHARGENFLAAGFEERRCYGAGMPPRDPNEPVIGYERPDGLGIYARVHDVMDLNMALANGYLRATPTLRAYR